MRNLDEINLNEGGEPVDTPSPTTTQISHVESLIGSKLPPNYINLLMFSNGGHPELDTFYFDYEDGVEEWGISRFFHTSHDLNSPENIVWNYNHRWHGAPRSMLPIADDGVGNLICLDIGEGGMNEVVIWLHDVPEPRLRRTGLTFEQMIDSLQLNPDYI